MEILLQGSYDAFQSIVNVEWNYWNSKNFFLTFTTATKYKVNTTKY